MTTHTKILLGSHEEEENTRRVIVSHGIFKPLSEYTETGERKQTWFMTIQTSVSNQRSGHTVPRIIQRVIIAQVKHNDDGWKQKINVFAQFTASVCLI